MTSIIKKGYTIKCIRPTRLGFIQETLGKDSIWYMAANNSDFKTLALARKFFKTSQHALRGSGIWIEGPRSGKHGLFS